MPNRGTPIQQYRSLDHLRNTLKTSSSSLPFCSNVRSVPVKTNHAKTAHLTPDTEQRHVRNRRKEKAPQERKMSLIALCPQLPLREGRHSMAPDFDAHNAFYQRVFPRPFVFYGLVQPRLMFIVPFIVVGCCNLTWGGPQSELMFISFY